MSIWAKIAKYGGSTLKGIGSYAKQGLKSAGNATIHPTQALRSTGSAMKTAAVGSAAGYVAWENLVNDKSMVEIASRERQRVGTEPCRTGDSSVPHLRTFWVARQDSRSHARHDAHRQQFQHQEYCER